MLKLLYTFRWGFAIIAAWFGYAILHTVVRGIFNITIPATLYAIEEQRGFAGHDILGPIIVFFTEAAAFFGLVGGAALAAMDRQRMVRTVMGVGSLGLFIFMMIKDVRPIGPQVVPWAITSTLGCLAGIAATYLLPLRKMETFEEDQRREEERRAIENASALMDHYRQRLLDNMEQRNASPETVERVKAIMAGKKSPESQVRRSNDVEP